MTNSKFVVQVIDHAHYMEEDGEYTRGEFDTREEAENRCKEIIDASLSELFSAAMTEEELKKQFLLYGEEASCDGFDASAYRDKKCKELSTKK